MQAVTASPPHRDRKRLPRLSVAVLATNERQRGYVASILGSEGLRVVGDVAPGEDAGAKGAAEPEAVVLANGASTNGKTIRDTRDGFPTARIIVLLPSAAGRAIREALAQGADGVVLESQLEVCLGLAVRAVCAGQLSLPRELRGNLAKPTLSPREKQVLGMVVMGFSNQEIATKLYLAESTVKSHLSSAFAKLGVRSRQEATALILDSDSGFGMGILAISEEEAAPVARRG
jgi:DNA-binding NarL/FixJ family response regulator